MQDFLVNLFSGLPFGYSFIAGMVASLNPCGFALLPSYMAWYLGAGEGGNPHPSPVKGGLGGLFLGVGVTVGFILLFSAVGGVFALGSRWLARFFPYAGFALGFGLIAMGLWLLITRKSLGIAAASRVGLPELQGFRTAFLFGLAYAVGSLACTLPIFLVVVGGALASGGFLPALGQFLYYALGMGLMVTGAMVLSGLFKGGVLLRLTSIFPYFQRVTALIVIGAGGYLIAYWVRTGIIFS